MKQELIKRFEEKKGYAPVRDGALNGEYVEFIETVIADLQAELNNKEQAIILFKELNEERDALQEKYDKLKERVEILADDVDTYACSLRFDIDEDELKGMKARHVAQLYLTPKELEKS